MQLGLGIYPETSLKEARPINGCPADFRDLVRIAFAHRLWIAS
jgi:hypothetical protein